MKNEKRKKDTYCITCGRKNCPKLSYCSRKEIEK